ncbi:MAG: dATP/dGTP diphosphohydrolase domain-containing protein [Planctomycetaceae bacterium]
MTTKSIEPALRIFTGADSGAANPKDRIGARKPPLHLVPPAAEIAESLVMALGAQKYGPFNWRSARVKASVYVAAARRHLLQWFDGEDDDPESGVSHLAHARACLGILLDALATGQLVDDRPPKGAASELIEKFTKET